MFISLPDDVLLSSIASYPSSLDDLIAFASVCRRTRKLVQSTIKKVLVIMREAGIILEVETKDLYIRQGVKELSPRGSTWPREFLGVQMRYVVHSPFGTMPPYVLPSCHITMVLQPPAMFDHSIRILPFVSSLVVIFNNPSKHLEVTVEALRIREIYLVGNMISLRCTENILCSVDVLKVSRHPGMIRARGFIFGRVFIPKERKKYDISWIESLLVCDSRKYVCSRSIAKFHGGAVYIDGSPRSPSSPRNAFAWISPDFSREQIAPNIYRE